MLECKKCEKTLGDLGQDYKSMKVYYDRYINGDGEVCSDSITLCPLCYAKIVGARVEEYP